MPHIQALEQHVAELIAAGEVVERPASVVKELVENCVDAGASAVVVSIKRGGMGMIHVTDNGCGIAPEELPTAFLRHATSKLRTGDDLGRIGTLGFRGEALAAISSVARVEMRTRERGAETGAVIRLEGGAAGPVEEAGAPEGTTITVRDLFFNTPARLKFMRKDSAETAAVAGLMRHLALSHPEISFKFLKDGTEDLHTPGDGRLESAIYAALGRDFAVSLIPVEGRGGDIAVSGFVTKPLLCRGSRSMQTFFVNGRFIKSQLLTAALEEGYRNQMMKGKFPGCVLALTMPPETVDVNVHPAKTQVKFSREREVFDALYHTVLDGLAERGSPIPAPKQDAGQFRAASRQDFFQSMDAKTYREAAGSTGNGGNPADRHGASGYRLPSVPRTWAAEVPGTARRSDSAGEVETRPAPPVLSDGPERAFPPAIPAVRPRKAETADAVKEKDLPGQETLEPEPAAQPWRIAGELLNTYIVCEDGDGNAWLIDKHAAHERVNFDRLKASATPPMRQTLLAPVPAELSREDGALVLENADLLERFGFACEDFGDGVVLIREVPADLDAGDAAATLEELAADLRSGRSPDERREAMLRTMACKASIKGGWESDERELRALVDRVQSGEVRFCPHGRPVAVRLTGYELEKMFKRS